MLVSCSQKESGTLSISTPEDFHGKVLTCQLGTFYEMALPSKYPDSELKATDVCADAIVMVKKKRADVAFYSEFYWETIKGAYPEMTTLESPFEATDIAFAINRNRSDLKEKLDAFIQEYNLEHKGQNAMSIGALSYDQVVELENKTHHSGKITVAISSDQEPFEYIQNGKILGVEPDIIRLFADKYDLDCEFLDMNFAALIPCLSSGKADIAIGMISITEERKQSVLFSEPWTSEHYVCVIRKEDYAGNSDLVINGYDDMTGKKIAVMTGSCQDSYLSRSGIDCEIIRMEALSDLYLALDLGKVDGLLTSTASFTFEQKEAPFAVCVCDTISPLPIGVAFNKKETALKEEFNAFLKEYLSSDVYQERAKAWNTDYTKCSIDHSPYEITNGSISVGVSSIIPPFCFMQDGQISGWEVEILSEFARQTGRELNLVDMTFPSIISFVNSGKGQMGACFMCITEERKQGADFSDPWSFECTALVSKYASGNVVKEETGFIDNIKDSFYKNVIKEKRYLLLLGGLWMTILISLMAALFGTIFGAILCLGYRSSQKIIKGICNLYVDFMRCMPQVVFLMIMFYIVLGKTNLDGATVAIIAFSLCFGAYTCVIFSSTANSLDKGQREAALAMGFSKFKTFRFFTLPQLIQKALPVYKNEFIGLVKATSIVGYIAVFDLTRAGDIIRSRTYEAFFPLIIVTILYFLIIWVLSFLLKYAEIKTQPKRNTYHK